MYSQVWQHWIKDFSRSKAISRFQFLKKFHYVEYLTYDPHRFNTKTQKMFSTFNHLSCGINRKLTLWNCFNNNKLSSNEHNKTLFNYYNNFSLHFSYSLFNTYLNPFSVRVLYIFIEKTLIPVQSLSSTLIATLTFVSFYETLWTFCLQNIKQLYEIVLIEWYYTIWLPKKLNNSVLSVDCTEKNRPQI